MLRLFVGRLQETFTIILFRDYVLIVLVSFVNAGS